MRSCWPIAVRLDHLTKISVTVISIVRLTILLKIDLDSPDLDYNFVGFVSWSIAESNMAIVAGTQSYVYARKDEAE